jgi:acyl carrier protein
MTARTADFDAILGYLELKYRQARHLDPGQPEPTLAPDYDLIENRVIDSLEFVEFVLLVEEHSGREISIDLLSREDFRTLESIRKRFFDDP